jgi:putative DNA primase/helicase
VACYLAGRSITIPEPPSLSWAPRCWHRETGRCLPAVVAAIVDVAGELIGAHRTYLRPDGRGKADVEPAKAMLGRAAGGAVRLAPASELLMVGEGIETCPAAMQACKLPAWAALSTSGMTTMLLPPVVRSVIVLADKAEQIRGAADVLVEADWLQPPAPGSDFGQRGRVAYPVNPRLWEAER